MQQRKRIQTSSLRNYEEFDTRGIIMKLYDTTRNLIGMKREYRRSEDIYKNRILNDIHDMPTMTDTDDIVSGYKYLQSRYASALEIYCLEKKLH